MTCPQTSMSFLIIGVLALGSFVASEADQVGVAGTEQAHGESC